MCVGVRACACVHTSLQTMGLHFLWSKLRAFLVTRAGTNAYVPLGQRQQETCLECGVQHCDISLDVVSMTQFSHLIMECVD